MEIIKFFVDIFRQYPAMALLLALAVGFGLGKIRIGSFEIGPVPATLVVALVIGQTGIRISDEIENLFFMLFLFAIGYNVGPAFFRSLKGGGLKMALYGLVVSSLCGVTVGVASWILHYNPGMSLGLFSGSQTASVMLGMGADNIADQMVAETVKSSWMSIMPICYAVTYVFGMLGSVILIGNLGPIILGKMKTPVGPQKPTNNAKAKSESSSAAVDTPSGSIDIMFMAAMIFIGALLGYLSIRIGSATLSLGVDGGALIGGLVGGWWHGRHHERGEVPASVIKFMNILGLNVFIAAVGINAGPEFIMGVKAMGWMLPAVGGVCTVLPVLLAMWIGKKIFKFSMPVTLGCIAGARTCTPALGALQHNESSGDSSIGFTVTYTVGTLMLAVWSILLTTFR